MKRFFAILLCVCMLTALVACDFGATEETTETQAPVTTKAPKEEAPEEEEAKEVDYKLGMGIVVSTASSKTGTAQVDATVATVVTDKDGKIVACRIDVAQNKMPVANGTVDTSKTFETKMELGSRYNMAAYGSDNDGDGRVLEWDAQTKAFEQYVIGKTAAEVAAIELQEVNAHMIAVDEALLSAGCTMQITDFMEAIAKACADEQGMAFKAVEGSFTLGVAAKTTVDAATKAATADAAGVVAMYSDFAASVVVDGKVVASLNDAIQPKIAINAAGEIGETTFKGTKRELKEGYNMAAYGSDNDGDGRVLEWYVQSAEFSKYVVGKTATEIAALETTEVNAHFVSADAALISAGCTMQITGIMAVVAQSANNAR